MERRTNNSSPERPEKTGATGNLGRVENNVAPPGSSGVNATPALTPASHHLYSARRKFEQEELRVVLYKMDGVEFATEVTQVQEIVRPTSLARVGNLPAAVEGLIKRRGRIVPIIDLRKRLGFPVGAPTPETCAIIVKLPVGPVGFMVDAAIALRWIKPRNFEIPSTVLARIDEVYIQGIAHSGEQLIVMLDLELLLSRAEQHQLAGVGRLADA